MNEKIIVVGTVKGVNDRAAWYYLGCEECTKKVDPTLVMPEAKDENVETTFKQVLVCNNKDCSKEIVSATPV